MKQCKLSLVPILKSVKKSLAMNLVQSTSSFLLPLSHRQRPSEYELLKRGQSEASTTRSADTAIQRCEWRSLVRRAGGARIHALGASRLG